METNGTLTQVSGNSYGTKPNSPFSPIVFEDINPEIKALGTKSHEEKLYLVLYNRTDEDSNGFILCEGRMECYIEIDRLLNTYPIDIHNSVVLVEIPAVNRNNKGEWVMKHPQNAPSIYQFCKSVEGFFTNIDFNIEDYNSEALEDDNQPTTGTPITNDDLRARMNSAQTYTAEQDDEVVKAYREMLGQNI